MRTLGRGTLGRLPACALVLLAGGCMTTAARNKPSFEGVEPTKVQLACGPPFEVQDDTVHRSLLISPGVTNVLTRSLGEACTDPVLSRLRPGELIYEAAEVYLRRAGRKGCTLERHETLLLGRLQVRYSCEGTGPGRSAGRGTGR